MGDFNHVHIQWKSLESTGGEDQQFLFLIQESFLNQHIDIVLSSQSELVGNVKIHEPLGNSDHNQIYFYIKVNQKIKRNTGESSTKEI